MPKKFLESEIANGFDEERKILQYESDKEEKKPFLTYVRPLFFSVLLSVTLVALLSSAYIAIKFFLFN